MLLESKFNVMVSPFGWCGEWNLHSIRHGLAARKLGAGDTAPITQEAA
jgi:hypothetical protein